MKVVDVISTWIPEDGIQKLVNLVVELDDMDEENTIGESFIAITDDILANKKTEKYKELSHSLSSYYSFKLIRDKLIVNKDKFDNDVIMLFIKESIDSIDERLSGDEENEDVLNFINSFNCDFDEDVLTKLDLFLQDKIELDTVDITFSNNSIKANLGLLEKSIKVLNSSILEKEDKISLFIDIYEFYSESQKTDFVEKFTQHIAYASTDTAIKNVRILLQHFDDLHIISDWTSTSIRNLVSNFNSYYSNYKSWSYEAVVIIGKLSNSLPENTRNTYYSSLQSVFNYDKDLAIKAWSFLPSETESEQQTLEIVKKVLPLLKADHVQMYEIISSRKNASISTELKDYCLWMYVFLLNDNLFDKALVSLQDLKVIEREDDFFSRLCNISEDKFNSACKVLSDFISKKDDISNTVETILKSSTDFISGRFYVLFSSLNISANEFCKKQISNIDSSTSIQHLERLLALSLELKRFAIDEVLKIISHLATRQDKVRVSEILSSIVKISNRLKNNKSKRDQFNNSIKIIATYIIDSEEKEKLLNLLDEK